MKSPESDEIELSQGLCTRNEYWRGPGWTVRHKFRENENNLQ